ASSVLASLAGMYHALDAGALPYRGLEVFLTAAVAVMLGGVGSLTGAAAVAFILGIVQSLAVWVLPSQWTGALVFALFLLLILLRPEGLLARPQAR
ncbi:MAG: branched-chain amino acid ABC transporter permease, partial [Clostridia bacterium]|nr:branched-chain amino acid ABC transporter permease [Clostridia bacterium]